jgi:hypothetical protein
MNVSKLEKRRKNKKNNKREKLRGRTKDWEI